MQDNQRTMNVSLIYIVLMLTDYAKPVGGRRDRDGIVVGFGTTSAIRAYHH
jgi:hypothetical protein